MQVIPTMLSSIETFSSLRIYIPSDLRSSDSRQSVYKSIQVNSNSFTI